VDTRSLVLHLREQGAMRGALVGEGEDVDQVLAAVREQPQMAGAALVAGVSTRERYTFAPEGQVRVAVVDYGCKRSILRRLAAADDANVTHSSLYDGTVEGLDYPGERAKSAQFHPEASPGPHDAASIISGWVEELRAAA